MPYLRGVKLPPKHQPAEGQLEQYDGLLQQWERDSCPRRSHSQGLAAWGAAC